MSPTLYRNKTDGLRSMEQDRKPVPTLGRYKSDLPTYSSREEAPSYFSRDEAPSYVRYVQTREVRPQESVDTYTSSPSASSEDFGSHRSFYSYESRYMPEKEAMPSTPALFEKLFPKTHRMNIKHDDSVRDGNMNLRIDTNVASSSDPAKNVTLFYLCIKDLKSREMSLRRYGREVGREVVNYRRKFAKSASERPSLQRSGSNFLNTLRGKSSSKEKTLQRQDSGYESFDHDDSSSDGGSVPTSPIEKLKAERPTNTMLLEFSNYAHVQVKRRGSKGAKKYEFEYWGKSYAWRRRITSYGQDDSYSYQLVNVATNNVVAEIRPDILCPSEVAEEERKGGFVPPCTMWFCDDTDDSVLKAMCDIADVVVATGIGALVDDCIKRKASRRKRIVQLVLPTMRGNTVKMNMEFVPPKRFLGQVFNRPASPSVKKQSANVLAANRPVPPRANTGRPVATNVHAYSYATRDQHRPTPLRAATRV